MAAITEADVAVELSLRLWAVCSADRATPPLSGTRTTIRSPRLAEAAVTSQSDCSRGWLTVKALVSSGRLRLSLRCAGFVRLGGGEQVQQGESGAVPRCGRAQ